MGNLFEFEDLGAKDLKGVEGHVRAWAALRASAVESRFEALHAGGVTELVGANWCRRLWNDRPLVAMLLLVLSPIMR